MLVYSCFEGLFVVIMLAILILKQPILQKLKMKTSNFGHNIWSKKSAIALSNMKINYKMIIKIREWYKNRLEYS